MVPIALTGNTPTAFDVNLRGSLGDHQAWIGYYKRDGEFEQLRAGYSPTFSIPWGRITPSFEAASHGYLGGSVNAENAAEILSQQDVDGALVGGASLDPEQFAQIVDAAAP